MMLKVIIVLTAIVCTSYAASVSGDINEAANEIESRDDRAAGTIAYM